MTWELWWCVVAGGGACLAIEIARGAHQRAVRAETLAKDTRDLYDGLNKRMMTMELANPKAPADGAYRS